MGSQGRLPLLLVAAGAAVVFALAPRWPTDQELRFRLGDQASRVEEVRVRCGLVEGGGAGDWAREVTFHYANGHAPRIVSYEPRLANGEYLVEIEVKTDDARVLTTDRRVRLEGGSTSIDLARSW
jgi:hypothetical protein